MSVTAVNKATYQPYLVKPIQTIVWIYDRDDYEEPSCRNSPCKRRVLIGILKRCDSCKKALYCSQKCLEQHAKIHAIRCYKS